MLSPEVLAAALAKAGVEKLPPPARAHLAKRIALQGAYGEVTASNIGGLRDATFGAKTRGGRLASFPDVDAAARATVANAYRAAPRKWAEADETELARLAGYPIARDGARVLGPPRLVPVPVIEGGALAYISPDRAITLGATRNENGSWNLSGVKPIPLGTAMDPDDALRRFHGLTPEQALAAGWTQVSFREFDPSATKPGWKKPAGWKPIPGTIAAELGEITEFKWSYLIPGYGPYKVVTDYLGPTEEAQATFRGLVADWEGFDRLGVGDKVLGPGDPRGNLRDDVIEWRKFRDDWLAGNIDSKDLAARLNGARENANKVRKYLADAKVIDPALADVAHDKPGVDVEKSATALAHSADIEKKVKEIPLLDWLTRPGDKTKLPVFGAVPDKVLWAGGIGLAVVAWLLLRRSAKDVNIVVAEKPA